MYDVCDVQVYECVYISIKNHQQVYMNFYCMKFTHFLLINARESRKVKENRGKKKEKERKGETGE